MKSVIFKSLLIVAVMGSFAHAEKNEQLKADREAVNNACSSEGSTAGCGSEKVGSGLLKCIHAYKKEHKDFKLSSACKESMMKLKHDRREAKGKSEQK